MYTDKDKMILDLKEENLQLYRDLFKMNDRMKRVIDFVESYEFYIPEDDIPMLLSMLKNINSDRPFTINNIRNNFTVEE